MRNLLPLFLVIAFAGCGKSDDISPVITLISPTDHQSFSATQMVNVKATITDNEGIHMLHLAVLDNTTNGHLVHTEEHPDEKTYNLNHSFQPQAGRSYTIEIDATDHNENKALIQLTVSCN
jgi:hypothetical protein